MQWSTEVDCQARVYLVVTTNIIVASIFGVESCQDRGKVGRQYLGVSSSSSNIYASACESAVS